MDGAWTSATILIPNVNGNLVITATATQRIIASINAVYTQSGTVYETDALDTLKEDLVVTAIFGDSTSETISSDNYTLTGTLSEGISSITVICGGKTASFNVNVSKYTYITDGIVANFDFLDETSYDASNLTIEDTEHGIFATFKSAYNNITTNASSLPTIRNNSVSLCYANVERNWGSSYFDTMAHELTYEYSYYLDNEDSLPWDMYPTNYGTGNGSGSLWRDTLRTMIGRYEANGAISTFTINGTNSNYKAKNVLNHCVYVYGDDGSAKFYINGNLVGESAAIENFAGWRNYMNTNVVSNPFLENFNIVGFSRSARIYNKVLTASEITHNYNYELSKVV